MFVIQQTANANVSAMEAETASLKSKQKFEQLKKKLSIGLSISDGSDQKL